MRRSITSAAAGSQEKRGRLHKKRGVVQLVAGTKNRSNPDMTFVLIESWTMFWIPNRDRSGSRSLTIT